MCLLHLERHRISLRTVSDGEIQVVGSGCQTGCAEVEDVSAAAAYCRAEAEIIVRVGITGVFNRVGRLRGNLDHAGCCQILQPGWERPGFELSPAYASYHSEPASRG